MKKIIELFNEMVEKGIIEDFAIGGGIATFYYTEAYTTYDLDIFIYWSGEPDKKIVDISPVFKYLENSGGEWDGEFIMIDDIPIQVIVADEMEKEAIRNAILVNYQDVKVKMITPEYLVAMFLNAGREKDRIKIEMLKKSGVIDNRKIERVITRWNIKR